MRRRSIYFEAKHIDNDQIEQNRLTKEQANDLEAHNALGVITFVLVSVGFRHFYRVPWNVWKNMKQHYGHKYMNRAELASFKIPVESDYIKPLNDIGSL